MAKKKTKRSRLSANRLVSKYISEIAKEETELIVAGDEHMGTKAEALARIIWKNALGFTELDIKTNTDIIHPPSLSYMKILLERMEGKVQDVSAARSKKSVADRVAETTKKELNSIAEGGSDGTG
jgi:hypothetical protein